MTSRIPHDLRELWRFAREEVRWAPLVAAFALGSFVGAGFVSQAWQMTASRVLRNAIKVEEVAAKNRDYAERCIDAYSALWANIEHGRHVEQERKMRKEQHHGTGEPIGE